MAQKYTFKYTWKRPDKYYGTYSPSDAKYKTTIVTLSDLENGKFNPPDDKYIDMHEVARDNQ